MLTNTLTSSERMHIAFFGCRNAGKSSLVNAFTNGWIKNWKRNGWKTADKKDVKNKELWLQIDKFMQVHDITWIKVKGHADNEYNNRCDELAVGAIKTL